MIFRNGLYHKTNEISTCTIVRTAFPQVATCVLNHMSYSKIAFALQNAASMEESSGTNPECKTRSERGKKIKDPERARQKAEAERAPTTRATSV